MLTKVKSFKDLRIWQQGMEIVERVYKVSEDFPKSELYGLSAQVRRAAVSVPSNIAEGFRRKYTKEYKRFLSIALASYGELETQIIISKRLKYMSEPDYQDLLQEIDRQCRMIQTLLSRL